MTWPLVPLSAVAEVSGGSTPRSGEDRYWDGSIPWVTPTDLPMPGAEIADVYTTRDYITEEGISSISAPMLQPGTVLFSSRASIGKIGIARVPLATNQGFANFTPKQVVHSRFLAFCLQYFTPQIASLAGSTTFKEVSRGSIRKFKIPLPPPSEQRRIVELLDQADALRRLRAEADAKAQRILPALFLKMFGDPATNPMGWPTHAVGWTATKMSDGPFGSNLKSEHYKSRGVRVFRLQNVGVGFLDDRDKAFISPDHFQELQKHECRPGDVIVGTLGDPNLRAFVQPREVSRAVNKADCVQIRVNPSRATPEWLSRLLNIPATLALANRLVTGQSRTRISMGRLRDMEVPVPPLEVQERFSLFAQSTEAQLRAQDNARQVVGEISRGVTHRAFSGELTAKWREAHREQLCAEMAEQVRLLSTSFPEAARAHG